MLPAVLGNLKDLSSSAARSAATERAGGNPAARRAQPGSDGRPKAGNSEAS
jgi:hypothetical protein